MNTTRPEADIEYSRGHGALNGDSAPPLRPPGGRPRRRSSTIRWGLLAGGLSGAALLAVAEFTPLFTIHTRAGQTAIKTVPTGSHDSYALLPVALLSALLSLEVWRNRARLALVATGVLGVVALLIALLRDLPDAHATGLVGSAATGLRSASSSPGVGLYLETLGAVVLLITAVCGLLLLAPPDLFSRSRAGGSGRVPAAARRNRRGA